MGDEQRVLSAMRPTGRLHLGHYHGVLKNWSSLQEQYDCFFAVADWHALTTHYEESRVIEDSVWDMVVDWLAAGINPGSACLFIQSKVPEIAELHLLLSMMTPLSWLERVPTYKDQQQKLTGRDLATYGFLGYPLLQTADILAFRARHVPVGEDQVCHVELSREIARRFNHLYGKGDDFSAQIELALKKLGKKTSKHYLRCRKQYQEQGDDEALAQGKALIEEQGHLSLGDKERLLGDIEGAGKIILPEPQALLTKTARMIGLDGQKMSKSYKNTIELRDPPESIEKKIKTMPTDPARVRRTDPGTPEKCPVWDFHQIYSDDDVKSFVSQGCQTAGIGCLQCKQPLLDAILKEQAPILERAKMYEQDKGLVKGIIADGCERARETAQETLIEVRQAVGLDYH